MMRGVVFGGVAALVAGMAAACSSNGGDAGFLTGADGGPLGSGSGTGFVPSSGTGSGSGTSGMLVQNDAGNGSGSGSGGTTVTTIYADTDTSLYTLDPMTNAVTIVGAFSGFGGGSGDTSATDLAVNAAGDVYINSQTAVYKAAVPASPGPVPLTKVATIAVKSGQSFYALAFAPAGVLGSGETLVGGDGAGELWSIDPTTGATRDLGNFGPNPSKPGNILGVSGDIVFYVDSTGKPTGLATIRSCATGGTSCTTTNDYLAGIDMTVLAAAYTSGTPATSLLAGVYGGATGIVGTGTGQGELFGLGAWEGTVFGFGHKTGALVTISTSSGAGTVVSTSAGTGWAGAGVSTKTTITVVPPPPAK